MRPNIFGRMRPSCVQPTTMADFWTEEREDQLIEMWRSNPCLYDIKSKEYANRNIKTIVLTEMAQTLSSTVEDVTKKLRSLRTQYTRLKKPPASGSAAKETTKRQDWLLKQLQFLAPHIKNRSTVSNLPRAEFHGLEEDSEDEHVFDQPESANLTPSASSSRPPSTVSLDMESNTDIDFDGEEEDRTTKSTKKLTTRTVKRRKALKEVENRELDILQSLADSCSSNILADKPDEMEAFGHHIIMQLRKISQKDQRTLCIVQNQIQQVIFNGLMGTFNSGPVIPDHSTVVISVGTWNPNPGVVPLQTTQEHVNQSSAERPACL